MRLQSLGPAQPQPVAAGRGAGAEKKQARIILAQRRIAEPGGQADFELVADAQVGNAKHRGTDAVEHRGLELVLATQYLERGFFRNVDRLAAAMDLDEMDDRQPRRGIPRGLNIAHLQRVGMKDADAIADRKSTRLKSSQ